MVSNEENLKKSGIILPEISSPAGLYQPGIRIGDLIYTSGQLPLVGGKLLEPGGKGRVTEAREREAAMAARAAALNAIAVLRSVVGNLDAIAGVVKLTVYVSSAEGFTSQHKVANGASELVGEIFGESGRHVRSAVGVASLPLDASVEIEMIAYSPLSEK
ncbi:RidA family protein [Chlorobaculum sp. 24CR]|uniref:RidA family protein n=1 Tax=Chlorobaculum sp. 24CR TaxID=2508878 RepID=UPI00100C1FEE|nr:RidA family protein [Chlorobaculum sp. 24CR]RXK87935.1 RidA family protein [Chlorobaculum sp. 24CR]